MRILDRIRAYVLVKQITSSRRLALWAALSSLVLLLAACAPQRAQAQFIGFSSPQTVQAKPLNAVSAPTAVVVPNLGQTVHYVTYSLSANCNGSLLIRIEASNDGVSFFPISVDGVDIATSGGAFTSAGIVASGYFPVVRVNLITYSCAAPIPTLTAFYSGTSVTPALPVGNFTQGNNTRLVVAENQPSTGLTTNILAPFGSTAGRIYLQCITAATQAIVACPGGITFTVTPTSGAGTSAQSLGTFTVAANNATQFFDVPAVPASGIQFSLTGGAAGTNFHAFYHFSQTTIGSGNAGIHVQGLLQPATTQNSETVSAANTAITKSFAGIPTQRVMVFSVSARCSAGTASLTVKDGVAGTTIWTTATTEVGTTTFKFQWSPGLASSVGNGMDIVLSTCGAANTGTLDVQVSQT